MAWHLGERDVDVMRHGIAKPKFDEWYAAYKLTGRFGEEAAESRNASVLVMLDRLYCATVGKGTPRSFEDFMPKYVRSMDQMSDDERAEHEAAKASYERLCAKLLCGPSKEDGVERVRKTDA